MGHHWGIHINMPKFDHKESHIKLKESQGQWDILLLFQQVLVIWRVHRSFRMGFENSLDNLEHIGENLL
jgi:hypothetical protein